MHIDETITLGSVAEELPRVWEHSAKKLAAIEARLPATITPVFTINGQYQPQEWTEWTRGFRYGSALLQFEATGADEALELGRRGTLDHMAEHVTHMGVHDHGFNVVSTYGNLLRLAEAQRFESSDYERDFYRIALKCSGAVQSRRWSTTSDGRGYIYSFNGPQSLFADTIRSLRSLAVAHQLGHALLEEHDERVSLLGRLIDHLISTTDYSVYHGTGRDRWDVAGRVVHECIFNVNDGRFRCPSTQQGYSPFSTWTRGHAWVLLGLAEQLEFLASRDDDEIAPFSAPNELRERLMANAGEAAEFYLEHTPLDGIPYWDTGAPGLAQMPDWRERNADPGNPCEPLDASAAAIAAQGLVRLGRIFRDAGMASRGKRYERAGLTVARTLFAEPYLSTADDHEGLLLHVVYHQPRGWDHQPEGSATPHGESCLWGDYHLRELALTVQREAGQSPYRFFQP